MMTSYIDNNGSMSAWIKGGSTSPEQNIFVGMGWLMMAELNVSSHFLRVPSFCNLADRSSRGNVKELLAMGAVEDAPHLPSWMADFLAALARHF